MLLSPEELSALYIRGARSVFEFIRKTGGNYLVMGLCGGGSIVPLLQSFLQIAGELDLAHWRRLQFFLVDERVVEGNSPDRNYLLLEQHFFRPAQEQGYIVPQQLHPIVFNGAEPQDVINSYWQELQQFGGRFDIVFLGAGEDGHVAALFPGKHWLESQGADKFVLFDDSPKPPPIRCSASAKLLAKAQLGVGLFVGEGKRQAYRNFLASDCKIEDCPAKILQQISQSIIISDIVL